MWELIAKQASNDFLGGKKNRGEKLCIAIMYWYPVQMRVIHLMMYVEPFNAQ